MSEPTTQAAKSGFGGFTLGDMELALPLQALREVVPCKRLAPLPCPNPAIVGGVNLRGVVVPVLDLRITLGKTATHIEHANVMIVVHSGHVLGLLCNSVQGVFEVDNHDVKPVASAEGHASLFQGALVRQDKGCLVSVLSPEALYASPSVPRTQDPEPERSHAQQASNDCDDDCDDSDFLPVMLMRCGKVGLCIDAMAVTATLLAPLVRPSPLAMGHCRGVIEHAGMEVPVIDLTSLLGMGAAAPLDNNQAFVMGTPEGTVAFLISEVLDVVRTQRQACIQIPRFARPHPRLVCATLPTESLPTEVLQRGLGNSHQFMLINAEELRQEEVVRNLSSAVKQRGSEEPLHSRATASFVGAAQDSRLGHSILTYQLNGETASPLDQVLEILPCPPDIETYATHGALLGTLINRGKSIPVVCLMRLIGQPSVDFTSQCSVLVVASGDELVGFAVPMLISIETAHWEADIGRKPPDEPMSVETAARRRTLIKVGQRDEERMLPLIDLSAIAAAIQSESASCPA